MQVTLESGSFGWDYILRAEDGRTHVVEIDYDYPGVASNFGWSPARVPAPEGVDCEHDDTDGTVDCPCCGLQTGHFLVHARQWLDDHEGESFEDPGYFRQETDGNYVNPADCRASGEHAKACDSDGYCNLCGEQ